MKRLIVSALFAVLFFMRAAIAQQTDEDVVWVQIEAHPDLAVAQERARLYSDRLADVNGFSLGGGWYGITLGPYLRSDAEQVLRIYRAEGQIPSDSFVAVTRIYGQQFWPMGADVLSQGVVSPPETTESLQQTPSVETTPSGLADETLAEARRSEQQLTGRERRALQTALQSAGFYYSAIDGAFGAGTRRSMADWQSASGFEPTGVLTTRQRKLLMDQYNAPLISVGMTRVRDAEAGIEIDLPASEVQFARYDAPFALYDSAGDLGVRVLLISQPGDAATLAGLFEVMQTLEIVPLEGPRELKRDRFSLEGRDGRIVSYTEAQLDDGQIKGFTLIWPVGDPDRRNRVLAAMRENFARLPSVLDPAAGADSEKNIDLVAGLTVRKPRLSRSGFYTDGSGTVVTTSQVVDNCTRLTLDEEHEVQVLIRDDALGVAVLRPVDTLAPMSVARFSKLTPKLQSDVVAAGFSFEGVLGAPSLTFGTLSDLKGLRGETELKRLSLIPLPGDAGGPVFDTGGGVMGMLLPRAQSGQQLPADVNLVADATAIRNVLDSAGLSAGEVTEVEQIAPDDLSRIAAGMTVLVSCWD